MSNKTVLSWAGTNRYIPGVPPRDLTEKDLKGLPDGVTKESLLGSGMFSEPEVEDSKGKASGRKQKAAAQEKNEVTNE